MDREMDSLKTNEVLDLTPLPADKKAIGSKWLYKVKTNSDGSVERYKARLVAKGFSQKFGSDYDETFCPVVRLESLRNLISLSTKHRLKLHHIDIRTAIGGRGIYGTACWVHKERRRTFSLLIKEKYLWSKASLQMLELCTGFTSTSNGFHSVRP